MILNFLFVYYLLFLRGSSTTYELGKGILNPLGSARVNPVISVFPSFDIFNGQTVSVVWSGILRSDASDEIGLYCPDTLEDIQYLRRYPVSDTPGHHLSYGGINVTLFYSRSGCQLRYLKENFFGRKYSVASSTLITFREDLYTPMHIHIALTNTQTEIRVMWTSGTEETPCVYYGELKNKLDNIKCGTTTTYKDIDMCEPPATTTGFIDPGFLHDVLLTNLEFNSFYFYVVGNHLRNSTIRSFQSPPVVGTRGYSSFVVYGDLHVSQYPGAYSTVGWMNHELLNGNPFDFVLHIGDISYARGIAYEWEEFGTLIEPVASKVPYMVSIGNHEQNHLSGVDKDPSGPGGSFHPSWGNYMNDSGGECGVPTVMRYHMPDNGHKIWWYSFDYGMVHVLQFSTEHDFLDGSAQFYWIEKDLASVNRSNTPWLVVTGHRPMYSSINDPGEGNVASHMRQSLEKLFRKYKVDFAFWGHVHAYERTCPVYEEKCVSDDYSSDEYGTVHFVVGAAGKQIEEFDFPSVSWTSVVECKYGYGRMNFFDRDTAVWKWRRNEDGVILDEKTYIRKH